MKGDNISCKGWFGWAIIIVVTLAGNVSANPGAEFGVFASYLDSDDLDEGLGGGVKLEMNPIDWLSLDARFSYIKFDDVGFSDLDVEMVPVEVAGLLNIPLANERIVPYGGVGVGYYFMDSNRGEIDDNVGFFPVVGLEMGGSPNFALFIEARWLVLETDVDAAEEALDDFDNTDIDGLGINLGLIWRF
jgi:hypothetical protein